MALKSENYKWSNNMIISQLDQSIRNIQHLIVFYVVSLLCENLKT